MNFVTARTALILSAAPPHCSVQSPVASEGAVDNIRSRDTCGAEQRWEGSSKSTLAACREDTADKYIFEVRFFLRFYAQNLKFKVHRTSKSYLNVCKDM